MTVPEWVRPEHREAVERLLSDMTDPKPLGAFPWPLRYEDTARYEALRPDGDGRMLTKIAIGKTSTGDEMRYAFTIAWPVAPRDWRAAGTKSVTYDSENAE